MTQKTLLLVEDDDAIADALKIHLQEAGFGFHRVADGRDALAQLGVRQWDLVLLDLVLPGADGWEVCRYIRQHHPRLPVIMLSARSAETHRVLGLELGADDYIAKPFSMLELVARVRALFRRLDQLRTPTSINSDIRFGAFCLNMARRELRRDDELIPLTLREFELLRHLVQNPGQAFSRNDLLEKVWGEGFDGYEHTVNSHINRLRTKIEIDPRDPKYIVTLWGLGYRFDIGDGK
jgi:DNA-binding response OmpR family regulator